jgi:hypothetical protein
MLAAIAIPYQRSKTLFVLVDRLTITGSLIQLIGATLNVDFQQQE